MRCHFNARDYFMPNGNAAFGALSPVSSNVPHGQSLQAYDNSQMGAWRHYRIMQHRKAPLLQQSVASKNSSCHIGVIMKQSLLITALLVLALCACGKKEPAPAPPADEKPAPTGGY